LSPPLIPRIRFVERFVEKMWVMASLVRAPPLLPANEHRETWALIIFTAMRVLKAVSRMQAASPSRRIGALQIDW